MYFIDTFFTQPWVNLLGSVALHFLWQGLLIAIAYAIFLKLTPDSWSRVRYMVGIGALLIMLVVPVTAFVQGFSAVRSVSSIDFDRYYEQSFDSSALVPDTPGSTAQNSTVAASPGNVEAVEPVQEVKRSLWVQIRAWLGIGWIVGAFLMALRLGIGWLYVTRLKTRFSEPVPVELETSFSRLIERAGIRMGVVLRQTTVYSEAVLVGWIKPAILLPMSVVSEMSTDHIEAIIAHELAHIKRFDYLFAGIQALIETVLFYHPAVWWVSRQVRIEREHCCDDLAVHILNDKPLYARALYELETRRTGFNRFALSAQDGSLASRIRRLTTSSGRSARMSPRAGISSFIIALVVTSSLIIGSCADFNSDIVSIGEEYDLPPRLASMVAVDDRDGIITYLHDAHNSGNEETLKLVAGVYDRASEKTRRGLMFVLAHINTQEADQVLIQMAESDTSEAVRHGALRSITIRSSAVGLLNEEKLQAREIYTTGDIPSDYSYPTMTEDQEEALTSSLRRIVLDDEQFSLVRMEAYKMLEPRDQQLQFADEVIFTSQEQSFRLSLISYLKYPEQYRGVIVQVYHSAPDMMTEAGALRILGNMGAVEFIPNMVDLVLRITPQELAWQRSVSRKQFDFNSSPREYRARSSMNWGLRTLYSNAEEAERSGIADAIDRELAPRIDWIERLLETGLASKDEIAIAMGQLKIMTYLVPRMKRSAGDIEGMDTPSQERARELLDRIKAKYPEQEARSGWW